MNINIFIPIMFMGLVNFTAAYAATELAWAPLNDACISKIKAEYEYDKDKKDKNSSERKLIGNKFINTVNPGKHPYGNNFVLFYVVQFRMNSNEGQRTYPLKIDCIVDFSGHVVGVETSHATPLPP